MPVGIASSESMRPAQIGQSPHETNNLVWNRMQWCLKSDSAPTFGSPKITARGLTMAETVLTFVANPRSKMCWAGLKMCDVRLIWEWERQSGIPTSRVFLTSLIPTAVGRQRECARPNITPRGLTLAETVLTFVANLRSAEQDWKCVMWDQHENEKGKAACKPTGFSLPVGFQQPTDDEESAEDHSKKNYVGRFVMLFG